MTGSNDKLNVNTVLMVFIEKCMDAFETLKCLYRVCNDILIVFFSLHVYTLPSK